MTGLLLALGLLMGVPGQVPASAQGSPYGKTVTAIRVPALSPVD